MALLKRKYTKKDQHSMIFKQKGKKLREFGNNSTVNMGRIGGSVRVQLRRQ